MASPARQISTDSTSDHWIPHPSVRERERQLAAASKLASEIHKLPPAHLKVATALAGGASISAAARAAGVHRSTVHNWIRQSQRFRDLLEQSQREYVETLREQMRDLEALALDTLRNLLEDKDTPAAVRLKAALAVLERPHFPKPEWHLPERIESDRRRYVVDTLADMQAELDHMRMSDALRRRAADASAPSEFDDSEEDASSALDASEREFEAAADPCGEYQPGMDENSDADPNSAEPCSRASRASATPAAGRTARNAPCPCGSGLKYKRCCGPDAPAVLAA